MINKDGVDDDFMEIATVPIPKNITLLAYFMAHAPAQPQGWFKPINVEEPDFIAEANSSSEIVSNYFKQRHIQWPRAWAEQMLMQLEER